MPDPESMDVRRLAILWVLAFPGAAMANDPGGATPVAPAFSVAPGTVTVGQPLTVTIAGFSGRARVRLGGAVLKLSGLTPESSTRRWTPAIAAGRRSAKLRVHGETVKRFPVTVLPAPAAPLAAAQSGVFPIAGAYTFGGKEARFGAQRNGHVHQGQDVFATEGTPLVSPVRGTVFWRKVQPGGAGHYLVIRAADGTDYVFMHLVAGSELVARGDAVRAGQGIGAVGQTGDAVGPHLHFEIWPGGWFAPGAAPIDPLPQLKAWAGSR